MPNNINVNDFLKQAIYTAEYFGFRSDSNWRSKKECLDCKVSIGSQVKHDERKADGMSGMLVGGINSFLSGKFHALNEPIFYYNIENAPRTGETSLVLQIFGVEKSVAEVVLIQTIRSLLASIGFADNIIKINSLGDTDSQTRYVRELNNFFKKRMEDLPPSARELMKESSVLTLLNLLEKKHDLAYRSPSPMEHLSDQSRKHFREIVEFLDMSEASYEIDPKLMGNYNCYHDAIFSFDLLDNNGQLLENPPLKIKGGRYNTLLEKHSKSGLTAAGAVIILNNKKSTVAVPKSQKVKPKIHLIHLGFGPKVQSLLLIDQLRKYGIAVNQNLASDSLSTQLRLAEQTGAKYSIIIGQKEYVEKTVILRDMFGKNQEIVPLDKLVLRLKKMNV